MNFSDHIVQPFESHFVLMKAHAPSRRWLTQSAPPPGTSQHLAPSRQCNVSHSERIKPVIAQLSLHCEEPGSSKERVQSPPQPLPEPQLGGGKGGKGGGDGDVGGNGGRGGGDGGGGGGDGGGGGVLGGGSDGESQPVL